MTKDLGGTKIYLKREDQQRHRPDASGKENGEDQSDCRDRSRTAWCARYVVAITDEEAVEAFEKGKAFIPFITCGDPSLEVTEKIVYAMEEAGADLIELGIPFSDPTAEGPVIQEANIRALSGGVTTDKIFDMVVKIRKNTQIPMVFMTYANVVYSYGTERFVKKAAETGMDGLILPDVPFEEKKEYEADAPDQVKAYVKDMCEAVHRG